jgi:hypothetical protein
MYSWLSTITVRGRYLPLVRSFLEITSKLSSVNLDAINRVLAKLISAPPIRACANVGPKGLNGIHCVPFTVPFPFPSRKRSINTGMSYRCVKNQSRSSTRIDVFILLRSSLLHWITVLLPLFDLSVFFDGHSTASRFCHQRLIGLRSQIDSDCLQN